MRASPAQWLQPINIYRFTRRAANSGDWGKTVRLDEGKSTSKMRREEPQGE